MENKILVPVDFGQQSLIALDYAKYYAKKLNATIHLLTVVEESGFLKKLMTPDYEQKLITEAQKALERLAEEKLPDFQYNIHVKTGKPYEQIEQLADQIKPGIILMGKTENPTFTKRILGSNTLHVIQETDFPVVSIRGKNPPDELKNIILLPLDLEKPVTEQVNTAIEFARHLKSGIFALSVMVKEDVAYETQVLTGMNKVKKTIEKAGIKCETKIETGDKSDVVKIIDSYANKLKPELTVIMTRSENSLEELFIGSVAKNILETLTYPVLSVKPWNPEVKENPVIKIIYDPMGIF